MNLATMGVNGQENDVQQCNTELLFIACIDEANSVNTSVTLITRLTKRQVVTIIGTRTTNAVERMLRDRNVINVCNERISDGNANDLLVKR